MNHIKKDYVPLKCPNCNKIVTHLVSLTDDGKGKKVCRHCKKKTRKEKPEVDYRRK